MKKDTLIVMCTPNYNRLITRRAVRSVKATDLTRAEFILLDNNFDGSFNHPTIMNRLLRYAAERSMNVVFLDDDVEIYESGWLERVYDVSNALNADIVGCRHVFESGEPNHDGIWIDSDGLSWLFTDQMLDPDNIKNGAAYMPTLCSALLFVRDCKSFYFDDKFNKYQHDLDICMQAWQMCKKVACVLDLEIIHNYQYYRRKNPSYWGTFIADSTYFAKKWADYIPTLLEIDELKQFKTIRSKRGWTDYYNSVTRVKSISAERAEEMFKRVTAECFNKKLVSGAHFHLYTLNKQRQHLEECLKLNPCHRAAKQYLTEIDGAEPKWAGNCTYGINCKYCHFIGGSVY
ncbi:glycosyltransferase family 2 protein [Candidatus Magnetomonas plexicatena]|uniref:glycosyltransferase family 2 protein n=1 Tax=Candidatus Magnetomonas plexicatena TaxID=2552947 RepID=UPI001102FD52|nr:hypothetical protein E2O03_008245 [Nitrospirales bacterium LBB_01]